MRNRPLARRVGARATRGQALVEFAIIVGLLISIVITAFDLSSAITARGVVMDATRTAAMAASHYLRPSDTSLTLANDTALLCSQIVPAVRKEIASIVGGGRVRGGTACVTNARATARSANGPNPAVSLTRLPEGSAGRLGAGARYRICVAYDWDGQGLLRLFGHGGPFTVGPVGDAFLFSYCSDGKIDEYRTR